MPCKSSVGAEFPPGWPVTIAGEEGICRFSDFDIDNNGNVFVTGIFGGSIDLDPGPENEILFNSTDSERGGVFVCKYDANGNYIWSDVSLYYPTQTDWYDIFVDDDGYLYVTGYEWDLLLQDSPDIPGRDTEGGHSAPAILTKYDPDGNIVLDLEWGLTSQGFGESYGNCVIVNQAGNIFVAGAFHHEVDFDPGKGTHYMIAQGGRFTKSCYLASFDNSGQLLWVRTWGGTWISELPLDMEIDINGDLYVTGYISVEGNDIIFDSGERISPSPNIGGLGSFLNKFNDKGDLLFSEVWGGPTGDDKSKGRSLVVTDSGLIYLLGSYFGSMELNINDSIESFTSNGGYDNYLAGFDSTGSFLWCTTWGSEETDYAFEIQVNNAGDILVCGRLEDSIDLDPGQGYELNNTTEDSLGYLTSFDSDGNYQWARTWPNSLFKFVIQPENTIFAVGKYRDVLEYENDDGSIGLRKAIGISDGYIMPVHLPD